MIGEDSTSMTRTPGAAVSDGVARYATGAAPLKILYAAGLSPNDSSLYRLWALERLGHRVVPLNAFEYAPAMR